MYTIRPASRFDEGFLFDMLSEALYAPPGREPFPVTDHFDLTGDA